jgi:hypothetical protein
MKKAKNILFIGILICCNITTTLFAQDTKSYEKTLWLEYEGPLAEHEKIIRNVLSAMIDDGKEINFDRLPGKYDYYPLISSFKKRIGDLANEKLNLSTYATKEVEDTYLGKITRYKLRNGLSIFVTIWGTRDGERIAEYYLDAIVRLLFNGKTRYGEESLVATENRLKDENFANLVLEARKKGIKSVTTENGFYDKNLAFRVARGILYSEMKELLNSNQEIVYRILYVADYFNAFIDLTNQNEGVLERMLKKYPIK